MLRLSSRASGWSEGSARTTGAGGFPEEAWPRSGVPQAAAAAVILRRERVVLPER
jgi:hypothetical protein